MATKKHERPAKDAVVAFKVDKELADLLDKLPNKSAFIRKAIEAQLGRACPLCAGKGVVPRGVHDHYAPLIEKFSQRDCDHCGDHLALPKDPGELHPEDRERLEQFFKGGPLYCPDCFEEAPPCDVGGCGMHVDSRDVPDHLRRAHQP
jgi:hypothetical protein